ncbi:helix-turn-helix transcriptional regulator [Polaribacter sp. R77954]|uniref:helix-turn-helix transcriptional regulator n=1 Tax=Polaribacter sp. R77954 TaxID=3093870 RepID=UPI0037C50B80
MKNSVIIFCFLIHFLFQPYFTIGQEKVIKNGDQWEYYDIGYMSDNWYQQVEDYDWKKGSTPLGYGDVVIASKISFGNNPDDKEWVEYFKKEITIDRSKYIGFEIKLLRDDGAVVYLNGEELFRSNMPNGIIKNNTEPLSTIDGEEEKAYDVQFFDSKLFKNGKNTIAVSVFQSYRTSSDLIFSLELIGHSSTRVFSELIENKKRKNDELIGKINDLNADFEYQKIITKNDILENSNYYQKIFITFLIIVIVLSMVVVYFIGQNQKKKIVDKNKKLDFLNEKILDKEKEMLYLSSKLLGEKQYLKEIRAELKEINIEHKGILKSLLLDINTKLNEDNEWQTLKEHFNAVYNDFYNKLMELHPDLSETELRHCLFIKLHLQTKEIARILSIDPRSVQTTKYRIKKKMKLHESLDLRAYLLKI